MIFCFRRLPSDETEKVYSQFEHRMVTCGGSMSRDVTMMRCLLLCLVTLSLQRSRAFVLDKQNPYSQFRKWNADLNGTLELEFKTDQPNGLLLYTDDGGTYDFFELKLVNGALRLRYNLGGGAQIITIGNNLHDGHWHKVQVSNGLYPPFPEVLYRRDKM